MDGKKMLFIEIKILIDFQFIYIKKYIYNNNG